jgi:hypothetical protein
LFTGKGNQVLREMMSTDLAGNAAVISEFQRRRVIGEKFQLAALRVRDLNARM